MLPSSRMTSVNTKLSYRKVQKMCTSICYSPSDHYFGRNLDYDLIITGRQAIDGEILIMKLLMVKR